MHEVLEANSLDTLGFIQSTYEECLKQPHTFLSKKLNNRRGSRPSALARAASSMICVRLRP